MSDPAGLQKQGLAALDVHNYAQAEQIFSELSKNDPNDYSATFNLGLAEAAQKKDAAAIEAFKRTLVLSPNLYQAELNLGMLYLRQSRPEEAIPLLRDVTGQKPDLPKPHLFLAQALQAQAKWAEAAAEFQGALQRDPKDAKAELGVGESLLHLGKLDQAQPHFEQAAALDPSLKSFLLECAVAFVDAGQADRATPILEQFPADAGAREKLGQIYLTGGQPEKAAAEFEAAVQLAPTTANRLALATAYMRSGQQVKAIPILTRALAAQPNDWELMMTVGRLYRDQRQFPQAASYFEAATKLKPDAPEGWSELAGVLSLLDRYPQTLAALDQLRALHAEKPGHIFLRAIILDKIHAVKQAYENYRQFLAVDNGEHPDQDFQAKGRLRALDREVNGR